ncbi:hypothetical protein [Chlamydia vaughanii]|uniref:hypothetical protein n=1 Tax=Chlamydia vaughanii TaxID=3112552 RepID=UPI0032B23206
MIAAPERDSQIHSVLDAPLVSPITTYNKLKVTAAVILAVAAVALIFIGALGITGCASIWLFMSGCILLQLIALAVLLLGLAKCLRIMDQLEAKIELEEVIVPPTKEEVPPPVPEVVEPEPVKPTPVVVPPKVTEVPEAREEVFTIPPGDPHFTALEYAKQQLEENLGKIEPKNWAEGFPPVPPPLNKDISYCTSLDEELYRKIEELLGIIEDEALDYPEDEETREEFYRLATQYLWLCYAEGCYTMEEVPIFLMANPQYQSHASVVAAPNLCYYQTFYAFPNAFQFLRTFHHECSFYSLGQQERNAIEARFNTPGTIENHWLQLAQLFFKEAREQLSVTDFIMQ